MDNIHNQNERRAEKDRIAEMPVIAGKRFITSKPLQSDYSIKVVQVAQWTGFKEMCSYRVEMQSYLTWLVLPGFCQGTLSKIIKG